MTCTVLCARNLIGAVMTTDLLCRCNLVAGRQEKEGLILDSGSVQLLVSG